MVKSLYVWINLNKNFVEFNSFLEVTFKRSKNCEFMDFCDDISFFIFILFCFYELISYVYCLKVIY